MFDKIVDLTKELLEDLYINKNMSTRAIAAHLGYKSNAQIKRKIKKFGIVKPKEMAQKCHDNNVQKGVDSYWSDFDTNEDKQKLASEIGKRGGETKRYQVDENKIKKMYMEENYSAETIASDLKVSKTYMVNKIKQMGLIKTEEQVVESKKQTNMLRWGVETPSQLPSVKEKIKQNRILDGNLLMIEGKTVSELANMFKTNQVTIRKWINFNPDSTLLQLSNYIKGLGSNITNIEQIIINNLKIDKFNKKPHQYINYHPDFKLNETNFLNTDGLYWHSELEKDNYYHFMMRLAYEQNNMRILQFRSDEVENKLSIIISMVNNLLHQDTQKIYARKCQIKEVPKGKANDFLDSNHIMGKYMAKHIGLYWEDQLISICSYKVYNNSELKIERFCSKCGFNIVGGFSKLLSHLEKNLKPSKVLYWVDLRYGTGNYLKSLEFQYSHETLGWKWTDGKRTFNRLSCRANMDERKLSEREYADELGWYKIYDAGQRLFIKSL
jgi:hypothetical protein